MSHNCYYWQYQEYTSVFQVKWFLILVWCTCECVCVYVTYNLVFYVCQQWWVSRQWFKGLHRHAQFTRQLCTELPWWATVKPWLLSFREAVLWTCRTEWVCINIHAVYSEWLICEEFVMGILCWLFVWGWQHCAAWGVLAWVRSLCQTAGQGRGWRTHEEQGSTIIIR